MARRSATREGGRPTSTPRLYVGKRGRRHTRPQAEINDLLTEESRAGRIVVRLKGGDPFMFGRAGEDEGAVAGLQPPALIVVGEVVGLRDTLQWFEQTRVGRPAVK